MKNKFVLDTSFVSSLLNIADVNHAKAKAMYAKISLSDSIIINIITKIELSRTKIEGADLQITEDFLSFSIDEVDFVDLSFSINLFNYLNKIQVNLKTVDLCIFITAIQNNAKLLTFDLKLDKEFKRILNLY
jgi:predicted nucleic acid-binding protein